MKYTGVLLFLFMNFLLQVRCAQQASVGKSELIPEIEAVQKSERIIEKLVRNKTVPGLAIVVTRKDSVVWKAGYGYADVKNRTSINPDETLFRVASVSKTFSAAGLMKMYENKKIDIDASLYKYVPDFPKKKYDFTIRQLASHTAGIRTYKGREFLSRQSQSIVDGLHTFAEDSLLYQPGKGYLYNSNDWNLLSVAMQNASKRDFEKLMKTTVFQPLGLKNIVADKNQNLKNKVTFYTQTHSKNRFKKATKVRNYYKLASGGYLASASDIAKFGNAILYNKFLKPETKQEMLQMTMVEGEPMYYGLGWEVSRDRKGRTFYGHFGNGVGGYTYFYVYPKQEMVFVITTNVTNPDIHTEVSEIMDNLLQSENES
ncbi:CubicO group peptidase, beta-lactamase class C family [Pustulibacterium marinum]|uniref:CubicO group peptidase, beta-lactamase class C family n=1 Tax=Pustulibacterium marinum TaxID=1224947 RepID=A0A1I7GNU6_9FLAO|nr:serine hydrolase domain-containing protein [Pustulibacterium marinum]SFU50021.1 CubicO group peptidase, beta-lactamase class C family [Pustulibacterium marinum]